MTDNKDLNLDLRPDRRGTVDTPPSRRVLLWTGVAEFVPVGALVATKELYGPLAITSSASTLLFGLCFLLALDGFLRILDAVFLPPREFTRWYRPFILISVGSAFPAMVIAEAGIIALPRSAAVIFGTASIWLGIVFPKGVMENWRLRGSGDILGPTGLRILYVVVGIGLLVLGIFGGGVPLRGS